MTFKQLLAAAAASCGLSAIAAPGAYSEWFGNAVPSYGTQDSGWTTSTAATLADDVLTLEDCTDGVCYTPTTPAAKDYQKQTITISSEAVDWADLPTIGGDTLATAKFAVCLALPADSETPVFAAYTADGWVAVESPVPSAGDDHTIVIEYCKTDNTFTITEDSTKSAPLNAAGSSTALASTTIVGTGAVTSLTGEEADYYAACYNGVDYATIDAAIIAAVADEYAHGNVILKSDYQIRTAGVHKIDPNGYNVTTTDGLYLGIYSSTDGYTVYDVAERELAPNICLSYLNDTATKVFDGVCVADIVDGGFSVAARVSGGYVTSTVRGARGTVVAGEVVRENGVAVSAKYLYYIENAADGYDLKGVLVAFTNGADGLYAKVEKTGQIHTSDVDKIASLTNGTIADGNTANGYTVTQLQLKKDEEYLGGLTAEYDFNVANGYDRWGTLTTTSNFGVSDGTLTIGEGETLTAKLFRVSNTSDASDRAVVNIEGTLAISANSDTAHVWSNQAGGGIMSAHWKGLSTWNVTGTVDCPNAYFELNYRDTYTVLNINGGTVTAKGLYANNVMGSAINLTNGGVLEVAKQGNNTTGFYTENLGRGTYRNNSTTAWTDAQAIQFTDAENGTVLDGTTGAMTFSGAITGDGKAIVKGNVSFTGSLFATGNGHIEIAEDGVVTLAITAEQFAAGEEVTFEKVTVVPGATVKIVDATGVLLEMTTAEAAGYAVWSGSYGDHYDETGELPQHWYKFDGNYESFGKSEISFNGDKPGSAKAPWATGALGAENTAMGVLDSSSDLWYRNANYGAAANAPWSSTIVMKLKTDELTGKALIGLGSQKGWDTNNGVVLIGNKTAAGVATVTLQAWTDGSAETLVEGTAAIPGADTAYHVYAIVHDGSTIKLYVDAVEVISLEKSLLPSAVLQFGGVHGGQETGFTMNRGGVYVDDWRVYTSAIDTTKQAKIVETFQSEFPAAGIGNVPYSSLEAALSVVTEAQVVDIYDGSTELPAAYAESCVLEGAQAWKKRNVYYCNSAVLKLSDDTVVTGALRTGDTIVIDRTHLTSGMWGGGPNISAYDVKYPIVIAGETDIGAGNGIAANQKVTVNYRTGTEGGAYLHGAIGAGARIDGTGRLMLAFNNNTTTINDDVVIDCETGFQKTDRTVEIAENATVTINGLFNMRDRSVVKLNAGSTFKTKTELDESNQVVTEVPGMQVSKASEDGYFVYALKLSASSIEPSESGLVINVADVTITRGEETITGSTIPAETGVYTVKKGEAVVAEVAVVAQQPAAATTLVAVPFEGLDGASVTAASLLNTKLLAEGDQLKVYDGANYRFWTLDENQAWVARSTISAQGEIAAGEASAMTLTRGKAVWVTTAGTIMTYGRKNADGVKPAVTSGVNLLGNTKMTATDLADIAMTGDEVEIPGDTSGVRTFTKTADGWSGVKTVVETVPGLPVPVKHTVETTEAPSIPAGRGYFLKRP